MNQLLKISHNGMTVYQGDVRSQILTAANSHANVRTIDGRLVSVDLPGKQKYRTLIEGSDPTMPDMVNQCSYALEVDCLQRFSNRLQLDRSVRIVNLHRSPVPSSLLVRTFRGECLEVPYHVVQERVERGDQGVFEAPGIVVTYRPRLTMRVTDFNWL
ncbi:MAG: hypothetical protein K2X53_02660, partial [Alphaproteobacteria bacterium]|nr:hypothetical protein [Alphaproteobacteria bacterium]